MTKLTKGVISRDEAVEIAPDYVAFIEPETMGKAVEAVLKALEGIRRNREVLTFLDGQYVKAKVTSVNSNDYRAIDGPIVRVGNGEFTWRVDGNHYAWPI